MITVCSDHRSLRNAIGGLSLGLLLVLAEGVVAPGPVAALGQEEDSPPFPQLQGTPHTISIQPTTGPAGSVLVTVQKGPRFNASSRVRLEYKSTETGYEFSVAPSATLVSPAKDGTSGQLTFLIPSDVGCGPYAVSVRTVYADELPTLSESNAVVYDLNQSCLQVPHITGISHRAIRGALEVTITGTNLSLPDLSVELVRPFLGPAISASFTPDSVAASRVVFRLPSTQFVTWCGPSLPIWATVRGPLIQQRSNIRAFGFPCPSEVFKIVTYNIAMPIAVKPFWSSYYTDTKDERAPLIGQHPFLRDHDVLVLQEAFDDDHRKTILEGLGASYPFRTGILGSADGRGDEGDSGVDQDGGVMILSKWPIKGIEQHVFGNCHGIDCHSAKGVLYAQIEKDAARYHILGTHLDNADNTEEDREARRGQLQEIREFIDGLGARGLLRKDEVVIIAGDFNIQLRGDEYFSQLIPVLQVTLPSIHRQQHPTTVGDSYVDYVLYRNDYLVPAYSFNDVVLMYSPGISLSDHWPVLGSFDFSAVRRVPPPPTR